MSDTPVARRAPHGQEFNWHWTVTRGLAHVSAWLLLLRVHSEGEEFLPSHGAAILAGNHLSFIDPIATFPGVARRKRELYYLAAAEFFPKPGLGWGLRFLKQVPVRRGQGDRAAIDAAEAYLREGRVVAVFPEGRINTEPEQLLPGKSGVARLALETGAPIIPVVNWGVQRRWPKGGLRWPRPLRTEVQVLFGSPITVDHVEDLPTDEAIAALTGHVMSVLESLRERASALVSARQRGEL